MHLTDSHCLLLQGRVCEERLRTDQDVQVFDTASIAALLPPGQYRARCTSACHTLVFAQSSEHTPGTRDALFSEHAAAANADQLSFSFDCTGGSQAWAKLHQTRSAGDVYTDNNAQAFVSRGNPDIGSTCTLFVRQQPSLQV